jgi:hypothetical protein
MNASDPKRGVFGGVIDKDAAHIGLPGQEVFDDVSGLRDGLPCQENATRRKKT